MREILSKISLVSANGIAPGLTPSRFPFISQSAVSIIGLSRSLASFRKLTKRVTTSCEPSIDSPRDSSAVIISETEESETR